MYMGIDQYPTLSNFYENSILRFNVPDIVTLHNELYVGQKLFLIQGTEMKIVEVMEVSEFTNTMYLRVKNLCDQETIELSRPLSKDLKPVKWIVISLPYIVELVKERIKQQYSGDDGW